MIGGYCNCACRDCFEIAISTDDEQAMCWECEEAGCEGDGECQREEEYLLSAVDEALIANEYEFEEDGSLA